VDWGSIAFKRQYKFEIREDITSKKPSDYLVHGSMKTYSSIQSFFRFEEAL